MPPAAAECSVNSHAVLPWGDRASLLFGTAADVLDLSAAVGDDPPEAAEAVRALDDLRDGHGALPRPPYTDRLLL